ncbi:MAG: hypothetical protein ACE5L6_02175 [Candidatus Bathyarchaeia archaeon]
MKIYVCPNCKLGAVIEVEDKLPENVKTFRVIGKNLSLSMFGTPKLGKADRRCPGCGAQLKAEKPKEPERRRPIR